MKLKLQSQCQFLTQYQPLLSLFLHLTQYQLQ
jgi:hypothetical protein